MKTPRDLLFQRHQAAEPQLDAIRRKVVAGLEAERSAELQPREGRADAAPAAAGRRGARPTLNRPAWPEVLLSFRWHLAGLGAAWLVILALNLDRTPATTSAAEPRSAFSPRQLLMAFRENRRQMLELIEPPTAEPAPKVPPLAPPRRSEIRPFSSAMT